MTPPRKRRLLRLLLRAALLLVVLVVGAYLLRGPLFGGLLRGRLERELGAALGTPVTIGAVDGGWLADLTLRDVRADARPEGALRRLSAKTVAVRYRLLDLLDDPLAGLDRIDVDGADVALDLGEETTQPTSPSDPLPRRVRDVTRLLPPTRVRGRLSVATPTHDVAARIDLRLPGADRIEIGLAGLELEADGRPWSQDSLEVVVQVDETSLRLAAPARVGDVEVLEAAIVASADGETIELHARAGGDVRLTLAPDGIRGAAQALDVAALRAAVAPFVAGELPAVPPATVDGTFELSRDGGLRLLARNVSVTLGAARLRVAELRVRGADRDAEVDWTSLRLRVPDVAALAERLSEPIPAGVLPPDGPTAVVLDSATASRSAGTIDVLRVTTPSSSAEVTGDITLPADVADWRSIGLELDVAAEVDATEALGFLPDDWESPPVTGRADVSGSIGGTVGAPTAAARLRVRAARLGERALDSLDLDAGYADGVLRIERFALSSALGTATATGAVRLEDTELRDASFGLLVPDLAALVEVFPDLPPLAGEIEASGSLEGSLRVDPDEPVDRFPDDVVVRADARGEGLTVDGAALGTLSATLLLDGAQLEVERLNVRGGLGRLEASGGVHLLRGSVDVPGFALEVPDLAALRPWLPGLEGVEGALQADGSFEHGADEPWRDSRLALTARTDRLLVPGAELREIVLRARADDGRVQIREGHARTPWGTVAVAGRLRLTDDTASATLQRLDLDLDPTLLGATGDPLPLRLRAPVEARWESDRLEVTGLDADFLGGRVRADLARGRDATLTGRVDDIDLSLLLAGVEGRLSGAIDLAGDPEQPSGTLTGTVPELRWQGERGRVELDVRQDAEGLHVARCELSAGDLLEARAEGYAPYTVGETGVRRVDGRRPSMRLTARTDDPGHWLARFAPPGFAAASLAVDLTAEGSAVDAEVRVEDLSWRPGEDGPRASLDGETTVVLRSDGGRTTARVEGGTGALRVAGDAAIAASIDWLDPAASLDRAPDAALSGSLDVAIPEIAALESWVGDLRHVAGAARADVTLSGTVGAPRWEGVVETDDVRVVALDDLPPIDRGRLRVRLSGRTATIEVLTLRLGYAPAEITGSVSLDEQDRAVLDLRLVGDDLQLVRSRYVRVRANLDARLTGPLESLLVAGRARVTDAWYTKPTGSGPTTANDLDTAFQLFSVYTEPWASMRFDLRVVADETVLVDNNVAFGRLSLDVHLRGTGAVPEPEGRVTCRDVAIRLPLTRMTVESATLEFSPQEPFDPTIRASAYSRIKGFDLDVQISGEASDVRVYVASSPPLRQEDALLLLATGAPPATDGGPNQVGASAVSGAGGALGAVALDWLSGPRTSGEPSLADRVEIYVGRETSESGLATVEAEVELFDGWYLRLERDRWEDYAGGVLWRIRFR